MSFLKEHGLKGHLTKLDLTDDMTCRNCEVGDETPRQLLIDYEAVAIKMQKFGKTPTRYVRVTISESCLNPTIYNGYETKRMS